MGGGLLQLVAYGAQDIYLTGNPQITFFKTVFRRHTNFAVQSVQQTINGDIKPDSQINFNISRDGDLLSNVILKMNGQTNDSFNCIDYIECEIGGQVIDKQYNLWMNIWCDLTHDIDKTKMLNELRNGIKITSGTVTVDQNQPSPAEMSNLVLDEVITYPGGAQSQLTTNSHPVNIVKHSSGQMYFTKTNSGSQQILGKIDNNGNVSEITQSTTLAGTDKLGIMGNNIYALQSNSDYLTKIKLTAAGNVDSVSARMIQSGSPSIVGDNWIIEPTIVNGVDTIGFNARSIGDVKGNDNMLLLTGIYASSIINRVYDNDDNSFEYPMPSMTTPEDRVVVFDNNTDTWPPTYEFIPGDSTLATVNGNHNGSQFLTISPDKNFAYWAPYGIGIIRRIDLRDGYNYNVENILGTYPLSNTHNARGTPTDGPIGTSVMNWPGGISISSDNNTLYFIDLGSYAGGATDNMLRKIDLTNNQFNVTTISTNLTSIPNGVLSNSIAVHPSNQYLLILTEQRKIFKYDLVNNTESLWFGDGTDAHSTTSIRLSYSMIFNSAGTNLYVANSVKSQDGVYRFFETDKINADPSDNDGVLSGSITGGYGYFPWQINNLMLDEANNEIYSYETGGRYHAHQVYGDPIPNGYNNRGSENARIRKHPLQNHGNQNGSADIYYSIRYDGFAAYKYSDVFFYNDCFYYFGSNSTYNEEKGLLKIPKASINMVIPPFYLKQHTSALKDVNNNYQIVNTIALDSNDNLYLCFKNTPGVYKVDAGADRENTPTQLLTGTETLIQQGSAIVSHPDGSIYITCETTRKIYKYKDGETTLVAGNGNNDTVNNSDPLQSSFSELSGLAISAYNDLMICDKNGDLRVMSGYKPFSTISTVTTAEPSYVPLQFWFCRNPGLALPLIALQYHEVRINIKLAESLNDVTDIEAWGDYIYLDTDERRRFAQISHEYLIEQTQFSNRLSLGEYQITNSTSQNISSIQELRFNHPVKEIVWTIDQVNKDDTVGRSNSCSINNIGGNQSITPTTSLMQFNGSDRFTERIGKYFTKVQRYQNHTGSGIGVTRIGVGSNDITSETVTSKWYPKVSSVQVYSFALNPEDHQPSSTCNFSRLDNAIIKNEFKTASVNGTYSYFLNVFAHSYNVLRIMSGMGGLAYSN